MTTSFSERLTKWSRGALVVPATIVVLILVVMPLGIMLRYSLNRFDPSLLMIEALSLENYVRFFSDPFYRQVMITTVGIASVSTFICLVLGFPAAYAITRVRSERLKGALILMVVVPLFMGNAVRTTGWMVLLGDHGLLNEAMMSSGLIREPVHILYTFRAVLIGLVSVLLPYMIIAMQTVLDGINPAIEDGRMQFRGKLDGDRVEDSDSDGDARNLRWRFALLYSWNECLCNAGSHRWTHVSYDGAQDI